jgi:hypothetical protein
LLIFLAIFGWVSVPFWILLSFDSTSEGNPLFWTASRVLALVSVLLSSVLALSAWRAWQHKSYNLVVLATILAMLPWSLGFFFAVPMGYAILRALADPAVRAAFAGGHRLSFARGQAKNPQEMVTEAPGGVLCIPIKLGSLSEHRYPGILRLEGDALVLEYMKGYVRAKVREAIIQISHLRLVRLTDGWFSDSLVLQTASLKSLEGIPNSAKGRLVLSISRKDRAAAERLIRAIQDKVPAVQVESPRPLAWREPAWSAEGSPVAPPGVAASPRPAPFHRKLRSLFNSVYTMFFSRPKNAEAATNEPIYEHPPGKP